MDNLTHDVVKYGAGPCRKCGRYVAIGGTMHVTYRYVDDEELKITTRLSALWCGKECCPVCTPVAAAAVAAAPAAAPATAATTTAVIGSAAIACCGLPAGGAKR